MAVGAVVLVGLVAAVAFVAFRPEPSAGRSVERYFDHVANGDAESARALIAEENVYSADAYPLLRDEVLTSAPGRPDSVSIVDTVGSDVEGRTVERVDVAYEIGGREVSQSVYAEWSPEAGDYLLYVPFVIVEFSGTGDRDVSVNGVTTDADQLLSGPFAWPVDLTATVAADALFGAEPLSAEIIPGSADAIPVLRFSLERPTMRSGLAPDVQALIEDRVDECAASASTRPPDCPFEVYGLDWDAEVDWRVVSYPRVDVEVVEAPLTGGYEVGFWSRTDGEVSYRHVRPETPSGDETTASSGSVSFIVSGTVEGVDPETVDVRLAGSASEGFSGPHKPGWRASDDAIAGDPEAQARLVEWLGDDLERLGSRPFDSGYRLGVDEPSDYDVNISSDDLVARARDTWEASGNEGEFLEGSHEYVNKETATDAFPHLTSWAENWSARLAPADGAERDVSWAVFPSSGPKDVSETGFLVHFRDDHDWIINRRTGRT
jgi:hypothetical protein